MGRVSRKISIEEYEDELLEREEVIRKLLRPLTQHQSDFIEDIKRFDITFGVGAAGTGKTFVAVGTGMQQLRVGRLKKMILVRPIVEAGENLGFLPGTMLEKVDPYFRPIFDSLHDMVGNDEVKELLAKGTIEIAPLAYMRGRTLNDAFILLDEAQNTTKEQMKMFLTRLGHNSKIVITGDISQNDLPKNKQSGLVDAVQRLTNLDRVGITEFSKSDVVRHPLVTAIIQAYEE